MKSLIIAAVPVLAAARQGHLRLRLRTGTATAQGYEAAKLRVR